MTCESPLTFWPWFRFSPRVPFKIGLAFTLTFALALLELISDLPFGLAFSFIGLLDASCVPEIVL